MCIHYICTTCIKREDYVYIWTHTIKVQDPLQTCTWIHTREYDSQSWKHIDAVCFLENIYYVAVFFFLFEKIHCLKIIPHLHILSKNPPVFDSSPERVEGNYIIPLVFGRFIDRQWSDLSVSLASREKPCFVFRAEKIG